MADIWNKVLFFVANFFNNRPLCFLSSLGGVRDAFIGSGFLMGFEHVVNTQLYGHYDELAPGVAGVVAGLLLLIAGIFTVVFAVIDRVPLARLGLTIQAFLWLFSAIMYALESQWIFAMFVGGYFSAVAGYIAFYYKYAPLWETQKKTFRDKWIAEHDPYAHMTDKA